MLAEKTRSTIVAAIGIAVLVAIASLASWSGTKHILSSSPSIGQQPVNTGQHRNENQPSNEDEASYIIAVLSTIDAFLSRYKDDIDAFSTFFIMVFTGNLGFFTISLSGSTRIAADAAKKAADAAIAIELPVIRAVAASLSYGTHQDEFGDRRHSCSVPELTLANSGRTKCFPVEVQFGWTIGATLPASPVYPYMKRLEINQLLEPDKAVDIFLSEFEFATPADIYIYMTGFGVGKQIFGSTAILFIWISCKPGMRRASVGSNCRHSAREFSVMIPHPLTIRKHRAKILLSGHTDK